jgi:bacillolysin
LSFFLTTTHAQTPIPKFAQPDNKSIKDLTVSVDSNGWLYFRINAKVKANELFTTHREAMGLQEHDKMVLKKTWRDDLGYRHNRYQQYYNGIEVMHGVFVEHFARNDENMYIATGKIIEGLDIDVNPTVKEQYALENAIKHLGASEYAWQNTGMESALKQEIDSNATYFPKGELVFTPIKSEDYSKENYRLTWQFEIVASAPASHQYVFVDAHSGQIVSVHKKGHGNGPADLRYYGRKEIDTQWQGWIHQDFRLYANDDGRNIVTKIGGSSSSTSFDSHDNVRDGDDQWIGNDAERTDAATAHWAASKTWDYYQNIHGRWGTNGNGEFLRVWSNFQAGTQSFVTNNDWRLGFSLNPNGNTEATLDIVGHEFTHGVLHHEKGPGFGPGGLSGENGALAESFGDIMGFMVERTTLGANNTKNFTHGEDCGQIFRNFSNPSLVISNVNGVPTPHPSVFNGTGFVPTNSSFDFGGIHHNCSVQNHWFFLLGNGRIGTGTTGIAAISVTGIGFDKAAQIVYRSIACGSLSPSSNFAFARANSIQAATDLFGSCSNEVLQTARAWAAVGVGNVIVCPPNPVFVSTSSPYGSIVCANNLEYPYQFNAFDQPGSTYVWNFPSYWDTQINGSVITVNSFGSVYDGQSSVLSATSSTGQVGTLQLIFTDCTNFPALKAKSTQSNLTLNVFPNPVTNLLALKSNRKKAGQIDIYDSLGRLILNKKIAIDEDFIDVSALKNGLYLLKLTVENESSNVSFFKN